MEKRLPTINSLIISNKGSFEKLGKTMMLYLFGFFTQKELFKMCKANRKLFNSLKEFHKKRESRCNEVLSQIKVINYKNEKHLLFSAIHNNTVFPFSDNNGEYLKFGVGFYELYTHSSKFNWTWKQDKRYWEEVKFENSNPQFLTPFLIHVCFADINFAFHHVMKNNYKLYFNQTFTTLKTDTFILEVRLNKKLVYLDEHFPPYKMIANARYKTKKQCVLQKQYICEIYDLSFEDFSPAMDNIIEVKISSKDNNWKGGWGIDGGILEVKEPLFNIN